MTDVKELIPEFFYLPEFLVNREGTVTSHFQVLFLRVCGDDVIFKKIKIAFLSHKV
jgi:hypothetical protein